MSNVSELCGNCGREVSIPEGRVSFCPSCFAEIRPCDSCAIDHNTAVCDDGPGDGSCFAFPEYRRPAVRDESPEDPRNEEADDSDLLHEWYVDFGSITVEARDEREAEVVARSRIRNDLGVLEICNVERAL